MMKKSAVAVAIALGFTGVANAEITFEGAANFGIDTVAQADIVAEEGTDRTAELSMTAKFAKQINDDLAFTAGATFGSDELFEDDGDDTFAFNTSAKLAHSTLGSLELGNVGDAFSGYVFTKKDGFKPGDVINTLKSDGVTDNPDNDNFRGLAYAGTFAGVSINVGHIDSDMSDVNVNSVTSANASYTMGGLTVAGAARDAEGEQAFGFGAKYADLLPGLGLNAGVGMEDETSIAFGTDYKVMEGLTAYAGAFIPAGNAVNEFVVGADYAVASNINTFVTADIIENANAVKVGGDYTIAEIAGIAPKLTADYKVNFADNTDNEYNVGVEATVFGISTYAKTGHDTIDDKDGVETKFGASYSVSF